MADQLSRVFAALADPTRRDMVARLTEADHTVNDLAAPYDVSLQAVSKHLKVLEDAGLVTRTREAQRRPVHLEAEVFDLMTKWIERYRRQAEERFAALDAVLARMQDDERHHRHHTYPAAGRNRIMTTMQSPDTSTRFPEAAILADEHVPAVHIWRDFDATVAQVMRAHTDADLFAQWIGPDSLSTSIDEWSCRTNGAYRYVARRGEEEYAFRGTFPFVGEDKIIQTFTWEGMPEAVALETLTLEDLGDGRTRLHGFSICDSFEARDGMLASGMEVGIHEGYAKLDRMLAGSKPEGSL